MKVIDPKILLRMYTRGFFPMASSYTSDEVEFYKPHQRFLIPISKFHIPRKLFKEFKKKNMFLKLIMILNQ